jgi:hypothetical protein
MEPSDDKVEIFPFKRGEFLEAINKIYSLEKFKRNYKAICSLIESLEEHVSDFKMPKTPTEDMVQWHNKRQLKVLKRQKERLETRIILLEEEIKKDIERSKNEL